MPSRLPAFKLKTSSEQATSGAKSSMTLAVSLAPAWVVSMLTLGGTARKLESGHYWDGALRAQRKHSELIRVKRFQSAKNSLALSIESADLPSGDCAFRSPEHRGTNPPRISRCRAGLSEADARPINMETNLASRSGLSIVKGPAAALPAGVFPEPLAAQGQAKSRNLSGKCRPLRWRKPMLISSRLVMAQYAWTQGLVVIPSNRQARQAANVGLKKRKERGRQGAQKNLRLCRVDAFENPLFSVGASRPGFGSHYAPERAMGLQAPESNLGSLRVIIGSSKVSPIHEHRRGFCEALANLMRLLYHPEWLVARSRRRPPNGPFGARFPGPAGLDRVRRPAKKWRLEVRPTLLLDACAKGMDLLPTVHFLEQGGQKPELVAGWLADFLSHATQSLDIAIYDWHLGPGPAAPIRAAIADRLAAGVRVRVVYDAGKSTVPFRNVGADPASPTSAATAAFIKTLGDGIQSRPVTGGDPRMPKLMHHKYIVRDGGSPAASLWTGSTNFTDDSWALQENNIVCFDSPELCMYYSTDFGELWQRGDIATTGLHDHGHVVMGSETVDVTFAPGEGPQIDHAIAHRIGDARRRLKLCTMLITSGTILGALSDVLHRGQVADYGGLYDRTQMESVFEQWQGTPTEWKIAAFRSVTQNLAGKNSTRFAPGRPHDFMHNKILVVDDTVITGSYNFSHSATENAENMVMVKDLELADQYCAYIDRLVARYGGK